MMRASDTLAQLGTFTMYSARVLYRVLTPPLDLSTASFYVLQLTGRSLLPVCAVLFPTGMVLALQGLQIFDLFGAQRMLSSLVSVAVFRELSPVLASVLVAAQGGSAFAAELGSMRIEEELDATEVMAVDSLRVHVAPRVLAAVIATPLLNFAGSFAGICGAWFVAVALNGENHGLFWANLWNLTHPIDLTGGLLKTAIFGLVIGLLSTYKGFYASGGAEGVGRAVNDTVVVTVTAFVVLNYFLTSALFGSVS